MRFSEFEQVPPDKRDSFLSKISESDRHDLFDQRPYHIAPHVEKSRRRTYFDDPEELHQALLRFHVPEAKPWRADEIIVHELAHSQYALAVGAVGVRYSFILNKSMKPVVAHVTHPEGVAVPNLVLAAIAANPYDSMQSELDVKQMRPYGYRNREVVAERIQRWNEQGFGVKLPELETANDAMSRLDERFQNRL